MITFGKFFSPMLLDEKSKPFDDKDFIYEIKYDGYRSIIHVSPDEIHIFSRRGIDMTRLYPELKSICKLVDEKMIFDGEIVAFKDEKIDFYALQKRSRLESSTAIEEISKKYPVAFVAFDCLYKDKPLINKNLLERKAVLDNVKENDSFFKVNYTKEKGTTFFKNICAKNLEGIVAKRIDSLYVPDTRSRDWIKFKNYKKGIFFIGGYTINSMKVSLLIGEYHLKSLVFLNKVAISKNSAVYKQIVSHPKTKKKQFSNLEKGEYFYFKIPLKCEIQYISRTDNGNLREPVFRKLL